jgi:dUTP pyrophosphatase
MITGATMTTIHDLDVCVRITRPTGTLPERATDGSSGFDLRMAGWRWPWSQDVQHGNLVLDTGERALALTGFSMALHQGWEAHIRGRSGLALKHGLQVAFGTIDADYRGEVGVILYNLGERISLRPGDRIAQLVFARVPMVQLIQVEHLGDTTRGDGGFGSTGRE